MRLVALALVMFIVTACGGSNSPEADATEIPTVTAEPAAVEEPENTDPAAATVKEWTQGGDRGAISVYWSSYWADAGYEELTPSEMELCITDKVINGCCGYDEQIPLTMMISAVSSECIEETE